jgi:amino acid transporter/mannitol/fructose-specific phosphotransferase system IIA component (Ntr-type)
MHFKKELNALEVFSIGAGALISSGLFVLPAIAYMVAINAGASGSSILWAYIFAGLLILPETFSELELGTAIPKAGGTYFHIERILGQGAGTLAGFASWFAISLKSAFALVGIGAFAILVFPNITEFQIKAIAVSACLIFTALNLRGAKSSGRIQVILVVFLIAILLGFVLAGYPAIETSRYEGFLRDADWLTIFSITGMVFIAYGGLTNIVSMAEEIKNPTKVLPKATLTAFGVVQTLYILAVFIVIGVLTPQQLMGSYTPISDAAFASFKNPVMGEIAMILTAVGAMLAFITTANSGIMSASRAPMAMSKDGLLPPFFGRISKNRKTPVVSILITSAFMLTIIIALNIDDLARVASLFMLLLFIMVNLSVIIIRSSKLIHYKPTFRSPLFPFLQIFGILAYLFLIFMMGTFTMLFALGFIGLTLIWYFLYVKKRIERKSAFIHMVESITNPELGADHYELENELLDILIGRGEIVEDKFDQIIRNSIVIDYKKSVTRNKAFKDIASKIAAKWNIDKESVTEKLKVREEQSSTLIYPGVAVPHAIPHIVIEGEHKFDIILVRNIEGIVWNEKGEKVHTIFCLVGTKDERNFHLRALMAIAQILQNKDFHSNWMSARTEQELRSVIILSERPRS